MNLSEKIGQVKRKIGPMGTDLVMVLSVILVGLIGFGMGRLSVVSQKKTPVFVKNQTANTLFAEAGASGAGNSEMVAEAGTIPGDKLFVASKSGTRYYYPWCSGVSRIKEENKVWFATQEEAEGAGYSAAANCKGL